MTFEDLVTIAGFILLIVCHIGYRHSFKHVYLKYKEQKVGGRTKRWKRKSRPRVCRPQDGRCKFMQCYCSTEKELNQ